TAKRSGARIVHSAGFDSIPFELGVWFAQETAKQKLGGPVPRVNGRVRAIKGGLSGGTAASGRVTMEAMQKDPSLFAVMANPFALTGGFQGPEQPQGAQVEHDPDVNADVGPFMMAVINTKNVHRANALMGHPWGKDFVYDEMSVVDPTTPMAFTDLGGAGGPKPGEGPSKEERETGFFDVAFIGVAADGRKVRVAVKGNRDPGYGSTSKMIAESAICLVKECADIPGGVWTPGAAMQGKLVERLRKNAGLTFDVEA
ncbi:MAG: saccharopine dehydrogenase, partial [Proteobacteria bacterium]|nr:saccharopine dehydrogenase [Pseudomonadota bacterium]